MIYRLRWRISAWVFWVWLKVTPNSTAKDAILLGISNEGRKYLLDN